MTERVKDGGPAFPHDNLELGDRHLIAQPGMSLRDWFAGQALIGFAQSMSETRFMDIYNQVQAGGMEADVAYAVADAMLRAREKGNDHE